MNKPKDDGGPAFPMRGQVLANCNVIFPEYGMSLRDYFAGQALAGWLASWPSDSDGETIKTAGVAALSYEIADSMIAEKGDNQ
jgi:hypothetical protein